jgi:FixJ family two-component response regulator
MTATRPVIRLVDDDDSFRRATTRLLRAAGYAVREFASGAELLEERSEGRPGCVLLDLSMPGMNGLQLQEQLAGRGADLPIVFLTGHGDIPASVRAMKGGAVNFLTKPVDTEDLLAGVREALACDDATREERDRLADLRARLAALTPREREVFDLVVLGLMNKQIAARLGTALRTVKAHRYRIMRKMQVDSIAELVRISEQVS